MSPEVLSPGFFFALNYKGPEVDEGT